MKGKIDFELYKPNNGEIIETISVQNAIMDNVLKYMAGSYSPGNSDFKIAIGTGFNEDENRTDLNNLINRIYLSNTRAASYGTRNFSVEVEIMPNEANGNLIEIGLFQGNMLYNRAIFKSYGQLLDSTTYEYRIVGRNGTSASLPSDIVNVVTGVSSNRNTVRLAWTADASLKTNLYAIYRKSSVGGDFKLLGTTTRNYFYDNGRLAEDASSSIPAQSGDVPRPQGASATISTEPSPTPITKTEEYAARAKITITFG